MNIEPVDFVWQLVDVVDATSGEITRTRAMVPRERFHNICGRQFKDGEEYTLGPVEEARSIASHRQYFASLRDGFNNLPEKVCARWGTWNHFRKWALVETGWYDEQEFVFDSSTYAERFAKYYRQDIDAYARLFWPNNGKKIILRRARSQRMLGAGAMGKDDFEKSKRDVLDLLAHFIDINRSTLEKHAGRHA